MTSQLKNEAIRIRKEFHKKDGDRSLIRSSAANLAKLAQRLPHPPVAALGKAIGQALSQFPGKFDPFSADVQQLFERVLKRCKNIATCLRLNVINGQMTLRPLLETS